MVRFDQSTLRFVSRLRWAWPEGAPYSTVRNMVHQSNQFGKGLRARVRDEVQRQVRFAFVFEQNPEQRNRVSIAQDYVDEYGCHKPVIHYDLSDYTKAAFPVARKVSKHIFRILGAEDFTRYDESNPGYFEERNEPFVFYGAGHFGGTHVMGGDEHTSVVNTHQQCWEHQNLYLAGAGSMPTMGTSNPTPTVVALAFRSAEHILNQLRK